VRLRIAHNGRSTVLGILAALGAALVLAPSASASGGYSLLEWWGPNGSADSSLGPHLEGIAVDGDGDVYLADKQANRVKVFTRAGTLLRAWGQTGSGTGQLSEPSAIALAPNGDVYVGDAGGVQRFTAEGAYVASLDAAGALRGVGGLAVAHDGTVYATDPTGGRVVRFSSTGADLGAFGAGVLATPLGVAVAPDGSVVVASAGNGRIVRFSGDGSSVLGSFAAGQVYGVAVDSAGTILAADPAGGRVEVFTAAGTPQGGFGDSGSGGESLNVPRAVAIDCRGAAYVADNSNNRVHVFGDPSLAPPPCVTPPPPPPPPPPVIVVEAARIVPTLGVTALAQRVSGTVTVHFPGDKAAKPLGTAPILVPMGTQFDTAGGVVHLTFAVAPGDPITPGPVQGGDFFDGVFTIYQSTTATLAELRLSGTPPACGVASSRALDMAVASKKRKGKSGGKRLVWGDAHGQFKTSGNYAAATVIGTRWETEDGCDGTRVAVQRGNVKVNDFGTGKTVSVAAGQSYLAKAPCASLRSFRIHLRIPVGVVARKVTVRVNGRRVKVRRGARITAPIDLTGRPEQMVKVRITVQTTTGQTLTGTRVYRTCQARLSGGAPPLL
jgi:streptogramin lyase